LQTAVGTLEGFSEQLPASLKNQAAKTMAETRVAEIRSFLETLKNQSNQGATL
jgi:type VI protein secretion system component VasF